MKIILSVFLTAVLLLFSGCIEITTLIRLDNNGGGTLEETVLINKDIADMIRQFAESMPPDSGEEAEEFSLFDEEDLRSQALSFGEGVEYVSGKPLQEDNKEGFSAIYSFSSINNLKINQNPNSKIPIEAIEEENEEVEEEMVDFEFIKGNPAELRITFVEPVVEDTTEFDKDTSIVVKDSTVSDTTFNQVVNMMKDMKITLELETSGEVVETNATHRTGNRITLFDIDFNQLLSDTVKLEQFKNAEPQSFEQFKDLVKDIPGIKVELNQPVIVKFK
jgi:hypothetical protein